MASIEQIIQREINPFDTVTFRTGNFWQEQQDSNLIVESIHQKELNQIREVLDLVTNTHQTRTILLCGERGSGKSYLLGRLKNLLDDRAFFAYVGPWANKERIWRHILRYDSPLLYRRLTAKFRSSDTWILAGRFLRRLARKIANT